MKLLLALWLAVPFAAPAQAQTVYGPPAVERAGDRSTSEPIPTVQTDRDCVKRWRGRAMLAHAADLATTVAAIESGHGREGNPITSAIFGRNVKTWEAVAYKATMVSAIELWNAHRLRRGDVAGVCQTYKLTVGIVGTVALLNLRVIF